MKKLIALFLSLLMLTLSATAMADTLIMGTNATFPPYEYVEGESVVGIDADIAAAICEKLGYDLEIVDMEFESLIGAVQLGKIDFIMAGMTVTEERLQSVNFSDSYATGVQAVIVPEDSPITSVEDLTTAGANYMVGVQTVTTGDILATELIADAGLGTVVPYLNGNEAVLALSNGKIDCVIIDNEPAQAYVAATAGLKILDTPFANEDYAAAFAKENTELLEQFNTALNELIEDGTIAEIIGNYIKAE